PRVFFDPTTKRVCAEEQVRFRDLVIGTRRVDPPPAGPAAQLLAQEVLAGRLVLNGWDHAAEQWILRLNLPAQTCPELQLPPIGEEERKHLIEQFCEGAVGYKDIKDKPVAPLLKSWLNGEQQGLLDKHVPERLSLSNGKTPKVVYEQGNPP